MKELRCEGCGKMYYLYSKMHHHKEGCLSFKDWHREQQQITKDFLKKRGYNRDGHTS